VNHECINSIMIIWRISDACGLLMFTTCCYNFIANNTVSFNTVYHAWAQLAPTQRDAPEKAEELLKLQQDLCQQGILGNDAMPDTGSYSIVMSAYSRSQSPQKVQHTYRLLQELLQGLHQGTIKPGTNVIAVAFSAVLNAAAHPPLQKRNKQQPDQRDERIEVVSPFGTVQYDANKKNNSGRSNSDENYAIVLQVYRELKDDVYELGCQPDHFVFAAMLHAIGVNTHPLSAERRQMIQVIFDDACMAGHVSKLVLKALYRECPDQPLMAQILRSSQLAQSHLRSVDQLPQAWTRKVPLEYRALGSTTRGFRDETKKKLLNKG
jgi:hypothetical protein